MKPTTILSIGSFFSACGDRMWTFAVGLYLIKLTPGSLQLSAIYGLVLTAVSVLFAPVVGDWVDNNKRLKVIRVALVLQNLFVFICAVFVSIYLHGVISNASVLKVFQAIIILLGALANLAGQGEKIAVTKDWVVVVCRGDSDLLAVTNALLRRIDLSVAILAPVGVGFLMTVVSDNAGIIMICSWNILSVFGEYFLLLKVYKMRPELAIKSKNEGQYKKNAEDSNKESDITLPKKKSNNLDFVYRFKSVLLGWKVYQKQSVVLAGISLSMLYLTVLGFSAITTGYAYSQGLSELYVSICFGLGSLVGIGGTFLFHPIKKRIGLPKTGLLGFFLQLSMLMFCVVSIWSPGSPSLMFTDNDNAVKADIQSKASFNSTSIPSVTITTNILSTNTTSNMVNFTTIATSNVTSAPTTQSPPPRNFRSIIFLMIGIILSRVGLWISDLTITQLQQENVVEAERGVVGGVQYSLNSALELLDFIVTIILPKPEQFGYLTLMSVGAVSLGYIIYIVFCVRFLRKTSTNNIQSAMKQPPQAEDNQVFCVDFATD